MPQQQKRQQKSFLSSSGTSAVLTGRGTSVPCVGSELCEIRSQNTAAAQKLSVSTAPLSS